MPSSHSCVHTEFLATLGRLHPTPPPARRQDASIEGVGGRLPFREAELTAPGLEPDALDRPSPQDLVGRAWHRGDL